jgi:hypothetical protein
VAVVIDGDNLLLDYVFQLLQIDDEACIRVYFACNSHLERVVMPVSVAICAFAKYPTIILLAPGVIPVIVRGGKLRLAS